jgi:lysophospholipase L1-like esterase
MLHRIAVILLAAAGVLSAQNVRGGAKVVRVSQLNNHHAVQGRGALILYDFADVVPGGVVQTVAVNLAWDGLNGANSGTSQIPNTRYGGAASNPFTGNRPTPWCWAYDARYNLRGGAFTILTSQRLMAGAGNPQAFYSAGMMDAARSNTAWAVLSEYNAGVTRLHTGNATPDANSGLSDTIGVLQDFEWTYTARAAGKSLNGAPFTRSADAFTPAARDGTACMGAEANPPASYSAMAYLNFQGVWGVSQTDRDTAANHRATTKLAVARELPRHASDAAYDGVIAFIGDSLTIGTGGAGVVSRSYPYQVMESLNTTRRLDWYNYGSDATQLQNAITYAAKLFTAPFNLWGAGKTYIAVLWMGTNDFAIGSRTVNQAYADLQTEVAALKAIGWKVVVVTAIPRSTGTTQASMDDFNGRIRANYATWASPANALADPAVRAQFDAVPNSTTDTNDAACYLSDHTHLTAACNALIAADVTSAIEAILAPQ